MRPHSVAIEGTESKDTMSCGNDSVTNILLSPSPSIRPQESEQVFAVINELSYFYGLNWIINTPDLNGYFKLAIFENKQAVN